MLTCIMAVGCVSTGMAEENLTDVQTLAQAAFDSDSENLVLAEASVQVATELVEATETFNQVTSLGVDSELAITNYENVVALTQVVGEDKPVVSARAIENAAVLADKTHTAGAIKAIAEETPIGEKIVKILGILGGIGTIAYGSAEGAKHFADARAAKKAGAPSQNGGPRPATS
jgi:hypothetical protein